MPPVVFVRWKKRVHATAIQRGRARCAHGEKISVMWTPVLLHSERRDGVSRHLQLARLTSIRACCIRDPAARAAWWNVIFQDLDAAQARGVFGAADEDPRVRRILVELANVVAFERTRGRARPTHARWAPRARLARNEPEAVNETNCFAVLGVNARCNGDELKRAWRRAAAAHHPDRGGDDEAFRRAKAAYDLCRRLRDPS